MIEFP